MSEKRSVCPACGEPVEAGWRICPACEAPLAGPVCPGCGRPVRENWKRCPECETRLKCPNCKKRFDGPKGRCPDCAVDEPVEPKPGTVEVEPVTGMEFVYVPAGEFLMGDTFGQGIGNEQPVHRVRLAGYYIGKTPVTQAQWLRIAKDDPSGFRGERNPVENVALADVEAFIEAFSAASQGRTFLLPTEAQWEYAARSGGKEELYAGGDRVDAVAWYAENSQDRPRPVATRRPNGLGICDMSGNVWEWCRDGFVEDAYEIHQEADPAIPDTEGFRVIRGGSWNLDAWSTRCARRFSFRAEDRGPGLGFRLVMVKFVFGRLRARRSPHGRTRPEVVPVLSVFTHSRVPISGLALGTAEGAFELAVHHGLRRRFSAAPLPNISPSLSRSRIAMLG